MTNFQNTGRQPLSLIGSGLAMVPVNDTEIEAAVLGAILTEPNYFKIANRFLKHETVFYKEDHQRVWFAMVALDAEGQKPGILDVMARLRQQKHWINAGYVNELLMSISERPDLHINFEARCISIFDSYHRRQTHVAAMELARNSFDESVDSLSALSNFRERIRLMENQFPQRNQQTLTDVASEMMSDFDNPEPSFLPTGITALDEAIGGFEDGCFYLIGARPSMGKSAVAIECLDRMAVKRGIPSGVLLLEGTKKGYLRRLSCRYGGFTVDDLKFKRVRRDVLQRALAKLENAPIYIDDEPVSLDRLESRIVALVMQGAKQIFVDYLQCVLDHRPKAQTADTVSAISRTLKNLAKKLHIPIIAFSQLSRGPENRSNFDKRPTLADLRDSGSLEQDADTVILLFRPEYYGLTEYPDTGAGTISTDGIMELLITKNREGGTYLADNAVILNTRLPYCSLFSSRNEWQNALDIFKQLSTPF